MGIFSKIVKERAYGLQETVFYYENRPLPFSEIWVNEGEKIALIIDHGLCEQPVCGATWSYRGYVKKQNEIGESYRCLRYEVKDMDSLESDLDALRGVNRFQRVERWIDPRKSHPQLIGKTAYKKQLEELRKEMVRGIWLKLVGSL